MSISANVEKSSFWANFSSREEGARAERRGFRGGAFTNLQPDQRILAAPRVGTLQTGDQTEAALVQFPAVAAPQKGKWLRGLWWKAPLVITAILASALLLGADLGAIPTAAFATAGTAINQTVMNQWIAGIIAAIVFGSTLLFAYLNRNAKVPKEKRFWGSR